MIGGKSSHIFKTNLMKMQEKKKYIFFLIDESTRRGKAVEQTVLFYLVFPLLCLLKRHEAPRVWLSLGTGEKTGMVNIVRNKSLELFFALNINNTSSLLHRYHNECQDYCLLTFLLNGGFFLLDTCRLLSRERRARVILV